MSSPIVYGSVCSGIEAATAAWHPLGWKPEWFCEIDAFPSAVLAHHHPEVPNYGDFTQLLSSTHPARHGAPIDLLVGGTPCQSFSHAGGRAGLDDPRGQLMLRYLDLVGVLRPRWIVWENVPGVLSSGGGRDFGSLLGGLADLGYGVAYRVLDARFFGVPQRRRRVFVVGHSGGDPERAARVLALDEGVRGNLAARGGARKEAAAAVGSGAAVGGGVTSFVSTMQSGNDGGVYNDGTIGTLRAKTPHAIAQTITSFTASMVGSAGGVYADGTVATLRVEAQPAVAWGISSDALDRSGEQVKDNDFQTAIPDPAYALAGRDQCGRDSQDTYVCASLRESGAGYFVEDTVAGTLDATSMKHTERAATVFQLPVGEGTLRDGHGSRPAVAQTITAFMASMGGNHGSGYSDGTTPGLRGVGSAALVAVAIDCVGFQSTLGSHGGNAYVDESITLKATSGTNGNTAAVAFKASHYTRGKDGAPAEVRPPLSADADKGDQHTLVLQSVAVLCESAPGYWSESTIAGTLDATSAKHTERAATVFQHGTVVRRLTPRECERLQGFPDDHTLIPWKGKPATDGHRYKALGNSFAVPVVRWIGERIEAEDARE